MAIVSLNPTTGKVRREYVEMDAAELEAALNLASEAFGKLQTTSFAERAIWMRAAAQQLEDRQEQLARLMTEEMGKPLQAARDEVTKCAHCCRYYAEHAESFLADEIIPSNASRSLARFQPMGVVLAIMPWNFPLWQVFRFAAPALMAGNVGLLKHASNVPECALAIASIFSASGFPTGSFGTLLLAAERAEQLLDDRRIAAATLTGSEGAGRKIGPAAGRNLKKTVLELGGSDPFIVMPSADLETALNTAVKARLLNNGQSCIAAKRFIVHEAVYPAFEQGFVERMRALVVGDPLDAATQLGPLATAAIRGELLRQVESSVAAGARLLTGGHASPGEGFFFEATVLADIPAAAPAHTEELFGPVASLFRVGNLDEALRLANDSDFGLGASFWSRDEGEITRFTREIQAGNAFVNAMVASDPRLPFGGVKHSGYGRELGAWGIREFVNVKTVFIA